MGRTRADFHLLEPRYRLSTKDYLEHPIDPQDLTWLRMPIELDSIVGHSLVEITVNFVKTTTLEGKSAGLSEHIIECHYSVWAHHVLSYVRVRTPTMRTWQVIECHVVVEI